MSRAQPTMNVISLPVCRLSRSGRPPNSSCSSLIHLSSRWFSSSSCSSFTFPLSLFLKKVRSSDAFQRLKPPKGSAFQRSGFPPGQLQVQVQNDNWRICRSLIGARLRFHDVAMTHLLTRMRVTDVDMKLNVWSIPSEYLFLEDIFSTYVSFGHLRHKYTEPRVILHKQDMNCFLSDQTLMDKPSVRLGSPSK